MDQDGLWKLSKDLTNKDEIILYYENMIQGGHWIGQNWTFHPYPKDRIPNTLENVKVRITAIILWLEKWFLFLDKRADVPMHRYDLSGRPFGAVFNLHKDYSKIFIGGFPQNSGIQSSVMNTQMEGQIESFSIGGKSLGLWNYKAANEISGALERNKLIDKPMKGLKFDGRSYLAIDTTKYVDLTNSFYFKITFKPERANGILLFIGDNNSEDYAALEIRNGYLVYSFNLGN